MTHYEPENEHQVVPSESVRNQPPGEGIASKNKFVIGAFLGNGYIRILVV